MAEANRNLVEGVEITLGKEKYVLPPLPLVHMGKVKNLMGGGNFIQDEAYVGSFINAVYLSLLRNYPEIQKEEVEQHIDMLNYNDILTAFLAANGFNKKESSGEAQASQ